MKILNDFDKSIIRKILELEKSPGSLLVLGNVIDDHIYPDIYLQLINETECPVKISKEYFDKISNQYSSIGLSELTNYLHNLFVQITQLMIYLEKENYIIFSGIVDLDSLGSRTVDETYINYDLKDLELNKSIYRITRSKIIPQESLRLFVNNDFKTESEIKETKNFKLSRNVLIVTAIGVIFAILGLIITFINSKFPEPQKVIILNIDSLKNQKDTMLINIINKKEYLDKSSIDKSNRFKK